MPLYRIISNERKLQPFIPTELGRQYRESDLEDLIEANPQVLLQNEPILVIGRQVNTPVGVIDLLGLDSSGAAVVIELKRLPSQREAIAQALEYVSWLAGLDSTALRQIAGAYLASRHQTPTLTEAWANTFSTDFTETRINVQQRVFVVIEGHDERLRAIAAYLRSSGSDINLVTYSYYKTESGEELLHLEVEVGPEKDATTADTKPSEDALLKSWDAQAVESYRAFKQAMLEGAMTIRPMKAGISFIKHTSEGPLFVCFFNAHRSKVAIWLRSDSLGLIFDFSAAAKSLRDTLPNDVAVRHTNVWYIMSFLASVSRSQQVAHSILTDVVAKLERTADA